MSPAHVLLEISINSCITLVCNVSLCFMFPVFNKEIALKNVNLMFVFTDSFLGPLYKIQNSRIQSCIYVRSIHGCSSHAEFSQGLGDNNFSQAEKYVTKITERHPLPSPSSFRRPWLSKGMSSIYLKVTIKAEFKKLSL